MSTPDRFALTLTLLAALPAAGGSASPATRLGSAERFEGPPATERGGEDAASAERLREAARIAIRNRPPTATDFVSQHRPSLRRGLVALGGYEPPMSFVGGIAAPPLRLYPGAGFGNSLNINPWTGQRY